mmetsp:Transcript_19058/g.36713  ORF Transcript_19058/g.36713 Transcript_19058/m.36713 type:complete len:418 (+) Transcript_19058:477-1730(+)
MVKSPRKTGYSSKSVTFDDLSGNFHLPINEVARKLGLCVTVLKQRCREYGIKRWPYRKVRKLDNLICTLESPLATGKPPAVASSLMVVTTPARASEADTVPMEGVGKLAVAKETRDFLLSNPNSTVHLSVGRVKVQRRRASSSVAGDEPPRCPTPGSGGGQLSGVGATSDRQLDTASSTSRGLLSESRKTSPGAWEEVSATNSVVWPQSRSLASSAGGNPRSSFVPRSLSSESGSAFRRIERVGSGGGALPAGAASANRVPSPASAQSTCSDSPTQRVFTVSPCMSSESSARLCPTRIPSPASGYGTSATTNCGVPPPPMSMHMPPAHMSMHMHAGAMYSQMCMQAALQHALAAAPPLPVSAMGIMGQFAAQSSLGPAMWAPPRFPPGVPPGYPGFVPAPSQPTVSGQSHPTASSAA